MVHMVSIKMIIYIVRRPINQSVNLSTVFIYIYFFNLFILTAISPDAFESQKKYEFVMCALEIFKKTKDELDGIGEIMFMLHHPFIYSMFQTS